jgi:hypothetical protein
VTGVQTCALPISDLKNGRPLEPLKTGRGLSFLEEAKREKEEEE